MSVDAQITPITEADLHDLTAAMTRAFDDDARTYLGLDRGGPEGYDNGDFFRKWLFSSDECEGYKIVVDGTTVGGILVWLAEDGNNTWGNVFIDPDWQNRGICTEAWRNVEAMYPDTRSWTLETPGYSTKNHRVYEKLGFVKIGEEDAPDHPGTSFIFRKMMK